MRRAGGGAAGVGAAWRAIAGLFALNGALFGAWAARIPAIVERYTLSHEQLGLLLLAIAGGAVCAFPFAGKAVDKYGAAPAARALALCYPVALIAVPFAPNAVALGAGLFVFGAAHGALDVAMNGWGAEVERRFARRMMASFHAMFSLGAGLGALSGYVAIRMELGLPAHFSGVSAPMLALALFLARIAWPTAQRRGGGALFALPGGALWMVGMAAFCASVGEGAVTDWSAVYLRDVTQAAEDRAVLGYAAFSAAMVAMRFSGDRIVTRIGVVAAARLSSVCAALGALCVVLTPSQGMALPGFGLLGLGYALIMPLAFSRAANDARVSPGQAIASVATLGYGGMLLGPPMIGSLAGLAGLQGAFGLLLALAGLIFLAARSMR